MALSELKIRQLIVSGETNQVELKVASPRPSEMAERTASRDLEDLVARGNLKSMGKTRGRIYKLP